MATRPEYSAIPRSPVIQILNANGTTLQTLFTMGANGGIVRSIWASSNDITARWLTLLRTDGTTDTLVMTLKFAAASATVPIRHLNFLDPTKLTKLDPYEIQWHLAAGHGFKVRMESAVTSGSEVAVFAEYGEF